MQRPNALLSVAVSFVMVAGPAVNVSLAAMTEAESKSATSTAPSPARATRPAFEFVSVMRAKAQFETRSVQLIDSRSLAKYLAGHIPGALNLRDEQLREAASNTPAAMLPVTALAERFGRLGISPDEPVMVYADAEDPLPATLVAYALLKAGHPRVSVLDGGFDAWVGTGESSQAIPAVQPIEWRAVPNAGVVAGLDDVRLAMQRDEAALVDARPARLYRGEGRAWGRNGHIPGAVNIDWQSLMLADNKGMLKPASEIKAILDKSGLDSTDETIVYCGTGREATLLFLYLKHVAKWPRVRLYEGSWTEYQSDPSLPAVCGAESRTLIVNEGGVAIGGQPSADQIRELADRGYRLVINCRTPSEVRKAEFDEAALSASLGMTYSEIPLGGSDGYGPQDVEALEKILAKNGGVEGVFLHCAGGPRAATLWAAYLVKNQGLTPADAMSRLRATGILRPSGFERLLDQPLHLEPAK